MATADLALVREFKRRAEQALPGRIVRVMLYGSRARGDAHDDSDWDVAVFLKGEPTPTDRRVLSNIDFELMMKSVSMCRPSPSILRGARSNLISLPTS